MGIEDDVLRLGKKLEKLVSSGTQVIISGWAIYCIEPTFIVSHLHLGLPSLPGYVDPNLPPIMFNFTSSSDLSLLSRLRKKKEKDSPPAPD